MIGRLPLDEQLTTLRSTLEQNRLISVLLERLEVLALPNWYLTAGCLFQTVWNVVSGRPPAEGIKDYDVFYFDDSDRSWEAEDVVIQQGNRAFADLDVDVEIRNEARVHLWYEQKFNVPMPPYASSEAAIDSFAATTCCLGVRQRGTHWSVYAPHGLSDVFNLVLRPNPVQAPERVYRDKSDRWKTQWPDLTVMPWPTAGRAVGGVHPVDTGTALVLAESPMRSASTRSRYSSSLAIRLR